MWPVSYTHLYLNYEHEVRFLRAFYYFELVKRYQNIPLITKTLTQATLSRDLKQLKVAKAASMNGKYVYVLPNNIMHVYYGKGYNNRTQNTLNFDFKLEQKLDFLRCV